MSNQNYNRKYYHPDEVPEHGRRYIEDDTSAEYNGSDDSFDVDETVHNQRQYRQNYDNGGRQQYAQSYYNYDRNGAQQYPQDDYGRAPRQYPRQQYPQDDYGRAPQQYPRQQYPQSYDSRYNRGGGYGDSYVNSNAGRNGSRPQKPPKKRKSGAFKGVVTFAVILLIVGLGIVGYKLYEYYTDYLGHKNLQALSEDFDQLHAKNSDFFGWLKIADTVVDYPVMYSPDEPERYLHEDFDRDYSESGELFADANIDPNGYHYLIYGHHMFNGSMFGSLPKYEEESYFNDHRIIRFDTMSERNEYEIFAVFYSKVYNDDEDVFKYYNYANLDDESTYNNYVSNVKALSIYDTGITPVYGEKIITLSTCNYHTDDGRFVVCARQRT